MRQNYKVYLLREVHSEKIVYVGLTRQTIRKRYLAHKARLKDKPKFNVELVQENLTVEQAVELEKLLIRQYDLLEKGYNKSPGSINGTSNYHSEEQKKKWSEDRKGKPVSREHAEKNRKARLGCKNDPNRYYFSKPVMCLNDGRTFSSTRKAAEYYNVSYSKISLVCNGKRKHTKGYKFVFMKQ